jgi:hypothetical protein
MGVNPVVLRVVTCAGLLLAIQSGCETGSADLSNSASVDPPVATTGGPERTKSAPRGPTRPKETRQSKLATFPRFHEAAAELGINFIYSNGASGRALMVEATGAGAGWVDFDGDGLLDLYLCQGGDPAAEVPEGQPGDQLFRQIEPGRFVPVSPDATIDERSYGQGVAIADFDDDGFDDVYVTNVGPNSLLRNQGDGTFEEIGVAAGVANSLWSSSAAWGDLDGDGDLDLYVCNYVDYDPHHPLPCGSVDGRPGTCHPKHVDAVQDECYFNQGDGTFTGEAEKSGMYAPDGKGLGVVIADFNNDALPDIYVANDTTPNFLFINQGEGRFVESANVLGCAVSGEGLSQASMGVAMGDYDHNGWLDLYCTHFTKEGNTLYKNLGQVGFRDVTGLVGLYTPTLSKLGFGTYMADFNLDGHEDLFVTNGHIDDWREKGDDYAMQPMMFSHEGPRFVDCSQAAGDFFSHKVIGRGVACGDFDNDGDWDLAVVHQNSPMAILRNDSDRGHWLKVRCVAKNNRRGLGTRVVLRQGERTLTQELAGGVSYCSAHESSLIFGLGQDSSTVDLDVRWPDGSRQTVSAVDIDRLVVLRQPGGVWSGR